MKWAHLPVPGGLYDQHPKLMDDFLIIMHEEARVEAKRAREQEMKSKQKGKRGKR